jgi:lycopene beta-cyclase
VDADLVLVGGGLANCLIAYRLSQAQPELKTLLVERGSRLGGEHTWSFNATDLTATQHGWMAPFVEYRWPGYEVRFPPYRRWIDSGYCTITSPRLHELVSETLQERVLTDCDVDSLAPNEVITSDGRSITAAAVIDGRGPVTSPHLVVRFQKFVGQVLRLDRPHALSGPILMDATVEQRDGYRFLYVLPFTDTTALIEDTRYSDSPVLERDDYAGEIQRYAEAQGWQPAAVVQEEQGVLPVALSGDIERFWENGHGDVARSGLRAALFHPTTGYSLPNAVRLADRLSESLPLSPSDLFDAVMRQSIDHWRETGLFRMLNRMLYLAAEPSQRLKVFQRFYRLPKPLIERFYAGALTNMDRFRLLVGQPPVPLGRAVSAVFSSGRQGSDPVNRAM